jgi:hypothetical protein
MNTQEISKLLGKYYEGETSAEEEIILREYFTTRIVPEEFAAEKEIFMHYKLSGEIPEPSDGLERRIISALDSEEVKVRPPEYGRKGLYRYASIAAGLLLLAGSYFLLSRNNQPGDSFTDPKLAYAETVRILYEVSSKMNHGTRPLYEVAKIDNMSAKSFSVMSRSSGIIDRNLRNLDYFQQALRIVSSPMDYAINK